MPRISNIDLFKTADQPALTIRIRTSVDKLPMVIGQGFGQLAAHLGTLGEHLAGLPFVAYHNMDMADLDVELGFPVAGMLPEDGDIKYAPVPGGLIISCMYLGPYCDMRPVYDEMAAWIASNGYIASGTAYEHYLNGPGTPEEQLLTQIVMPLK